MKEAMSRQTGSVQYARLMQDAMQEYSFSMEQFRLGQIEEAADGGSEPSGLREPTEPSCGTLTGSATGTVSIVPLVSLVPLPPLPVVLGVGSAVAGPALR